MELCLYLESKKFVLFSKTRQHKRRNHLFGLLGHFVVLKDHCTDLQEQRSWDTYHLYDYNDWPLLGYTIRFNPGVKFEYMGREK
mgnify:FL=1